MKVTIVGAGNIGTQFAVHCAEKGHAVTVYSSKPEMIHDVLEIVNENNEVIHRGKIKQATNDIKVAFENTEFIFVTVPAMMMKVTAEKIKPYANDNMRICLVPGTGGGECAFKECVEKGATVVGMQRVPSVARLVQYGQRVRAVGYRDELFAAAIPRGKTEECSKIIEDIFDMKTSAIPNYLNITLTPSNPILHTTRLRKIYEDYKEGVVYKRVPLFYEEWTNESSELLLACDEEIQQICRKMSQFDLSYVKSLRIHYESPDAIALTKKISSIKGFQGIQSPAVEVPGGFIPDFNSRYFTADFSYGLTILVQIAEFVQVAVPNMKETLDWYHGLVGEVKEYNFGEYGIRNCEEFLSFYSK